MMKTINYLAFGAVFALMFFLSASDVFAYEAGVDKTELTQEECLTLTWSGFGGNTNIFVYKGNSYWTDVDTQAYYQGTQEICTNGWEVRDDYKIRVELKSNPTIYVYSQSFAVQGPKPYLMDFLINGGASSTTAQTVSLQFNFTIANPTHYMASGSSNFTGASWIMYGGVNTVNFTLSNGAGTKFVYFKLKNAYGESGVEWDNISYDPIMYYYVSGYVRDGNGQGVSGVLLSGFPSGTTTTNSSGYYKVENIISTWSGTITVSKDGYTFSPSSRSYSSLTGNMANQNFTAIPDYVETYYWQTSTWGQCNDGCGGGVKTRSVWCERNSDGQSMSKSYCTGTKPSSVSDDCECNAPPELINSMGGQSYTSP